jgi:hypothetical protein
MEKVSSLAKGAEILLNQKKTMKNPVALPWIKEVLIKKLLLRVFSAISKRLKLKKYKL